MLLKRTIASRVTLAKLFLSLPLSFLVISVVSPALKAEDARLTLNTLVVPTSSFYRDGQPVKFALYGFSKNLREEMKPHGIKVTSVHPGAVLTDSWAGYDNSSKRIMEAEDVAKLVFAASQLSIQACVEDIILRPQLGDL